MRSKKIPIAERLLKYITKNPNSCWDWTGATSEGYGIIGIDGINKQARRIVYEMYKNKIPKGECLLSICRNKLCVNPDHNINSSESIHLYVNKTGINGCWIWTRIGSISKKGYGTFQIKGKIKYVHRIFYEKYKGKIPKKMCVCHKCDVPLCCNPDHLFLGTQQENIKDMINKKRDKKSKGEDHKNCIMSEEHAKEIKTKFKDGLSIKEIYHLYMYSYSSIWKICKNRSWKHIII
jgi:hypothetical protein